jgi:hypothetical protein
LVGYSGTSNSRGQYRMTGTSTAVPHVAGAAAVVRAARPSWSNLEVRHYLESAAIDIYPPGTDTTSGAGRLHLGNPLPDASQCAATASPSAIPFAEGGGSGSVSVTAPPGCPWFAASHASWIEVIGSAHGYGSGSVAFDVTSNRSDTPRQGSLLVAGCEVSVTQEAGPRRAQPRRASGRASSAN